MMQNRQTAKYKQQLGAWLLVLACVFCSGCLPPEAPRWSPDGRKLAFGHYAASNAAPELWLLDLDSDPPLRLLAPAGRSPRWIPDGTGLYCLVRRGTKRKNEQYKSERWEIQHIDLSGKEPINKLFMRLKGGSIPALDMAPDGRHLVYIKQYVFDGQPHTSLWRASLTEDTELEITEPDARPRTFALSPDGRFVAYADITPTPDGAVCRVFLTASDGTTGALEVASGQTFQDKPYRLGFLPGGRRLFLFDGSNTVRTVSVDGFGRRERSYPVMPDGWFVLAVTPTLDDRALFVTAAGPRQKVKVIELSLDLASGRTKQLDQAPGQLVGLRSYGPRRRVVARYTAGGLQVAELAGKWENYYPLNAAELRTAVDRLVAQGGDQLAAGIDLLEESLGLHGAPEPDILGRADADVGELHLLHCDLLLKTGRHKEAAGAFLQGMLAFPLRSGLYDEAGLFMRMAPAGEPLVTPLHEARRAIAQQDVRQARALLGQMLIDTARPDQTAGLHFLMGLADLRGLETGAQPTSAKRGAADFAQAAEEKSFRLRDYAAALEALVYAVGPRARSRRAVELIQKALDHHPRSPLVADLKAARQKLRALPPNIWSPYRSVNLKLGEVTLWAEQRARYGLNVSLQPQSEAQTDQPPRRLRLTDTVRYRIRAGKDRRNAVVLVDDLPVAVGSMTLSPDRLRLAFVATAGADHWGVYVVDVWGKFSYGDEAALRAGRVPRGARIEQLRWQAANEDELEYQISGDPAAGGSQWHSIEFADEEGDVF